MDIPQDAPDESPDTSEVVNLLGEDGDTNTNTMSTENKIKEALKILRYN